MPASTAVSRGSRSPSPLSSSYSQATLSATLAVPVDAHMADSVNGIADGNLASVPIERSGSSSSSTAGASTVSSARRKGAALRGGRSANMRGQSGSSNGVRRIKKESARSTPSRPKNGTGNKRLSRSARSSLSPRPIKSELGSGSDNSDDDITREEDGLDDADDDVNSTRSNGDGPGMDGNTSDNGPYCICRGPDDHRWMIQCDDCEDWFHGDCVNIKKDEGENMMLSYICPNCTIPGRYVTRYRRLCSLPGCRRAARLYGEDGMSPAEAPLLTSASATASHFCSDSHRDQWWDGLLSQLTTDRRSSAALCAGRRASAAAEAKMAIDLFSPAQLLAVLAHTHQPGVAPMLLHGLVSDHHQKKKLPAAADVDPACMTVEERETTQTSAADRLHLAEQLVMCQKMLQLLDMAKARSQEAIKAGLVERDSCGYDQRLQHVGVQPHFQQFLSSPEGAALLAGDTLQAPQLDANGQPIDYSKTSRLKNGGHADDNDAADAPGLFLAKDAAGMCGKRKCKAHASWYSTLARDVRMQMHEFTRQATALRNNETRIRLAAVQRSFIKEHSACEVRYIGDSDNSLTALTSDSEYGDNDDDSESDSHHDSEDECIADTEKTKDESEQEDDARSCASLNHNTAPDSAFPEKEEDEDMVDLVGYGGDSENDDLG
ncbi:COMPASS (complex proteins associated with Set1p) component [Sporothrix epigloea]|uniref:COMPASS (Complex proteins associated with Set1p) component n=1 Tax=Sporothrix epigloea TaxID=1892477 RepID=A0ABP0E7R5_9PEZI